MKELKDLSELLNTPISGDEAVTEAVKQLKQKRVIMERVSNMITIQVIKIINQIMNEEFVPQMEKMLLNKKLNPMNIDSYIDWINTSYVGLWIENPDWKYFGIAIEFERRWLKDPIIGFHIKEGYKREEIKCWETLKEKYSKRDPKNSNWIYKSFKGPKDWHTIDAIEKIKNGKMVELFEEMIDEILDCAKDIDQI